MSGLFLASQYKTKPHFPIKVVRVVGAKHIDHQMVQHALYSLVTQGFFNVEVEAIKERILQSSWVSDVSVRKVWPDQVWITIIEKKPIARWNVDSLLSSSGELFIPDTGTPPIDLPEFIGPDGKQIFIMQYYNRINNLLTPLHFKVARLEWSSANLWNVTLNNGMKLTVAHKDFLTRFSHFVKVYPKVIGDRANQIDYVDLRYPNGLAVRWKSVT
jgi:cell division protein FtsQ